MIRTGVLVVFLTMACGGESSSPTADAGSDVAATETGGGACIGGSEARLLCGAGVDSCFRVDDAGVVHGGGTVTSCMGWAEAQHCRPLPPPCYVCPTGAGRLWRESDLRAFYGPSAPDGGACPSVPDGGVDDVRF